MENSNKYIRYIIRLAVISTISALVCQAGMYISCLNAGSIMHMPSVKNGIIFIIVAFVMTAGLDLLFNEVTPYNQKTAAWLVIIGVFTFLAVFINLLNPIVSTDGRVAYRYPELAAIAFGVALCELIIRKEKPQFKNIIVIPDFKNVESIFAVISLIFGIVLAIILPAKTIICWDDDEHYRETLYLSQGIYTAYDDTEVNLIYGWKEDAAENLSDVENNGSLYMDSDAFSMRPTRVGQIGFVLGMWFGQILQLDAAKVFTLGRIGGLAVYTLIMYYAIKRLKNGKMLLCLIGLAPIAIFLSVGYSYDAWVLAFMSLGFAYFFGALQRNEGSLTTKEIVIMIGAMFIGTWPKMPYIFMILIYFLMPKSKFADEKQRKKYYIAIISVIIFSLVYTLITMLNSGHNGDYRGGEGINAYEQIPYILNHPIEYARTLISFLKGYIGCQGYLSSFAHLNGTVSYKVLVLAMVIAALIDTGEKSPLFTPVNRILGVVIIILQLALVATIFYLVYTPVGLSEIRGCQERYMLQLLMPAFLLMFSGWFTFPKIKKQYYNIAFYAVSVICLIWNFVVCL